MTTIAQARTIVQDLATTAWAAAPTAGAPLLYDNKRNDPPPVGNFGRSTMRIFAATQTTQGNAVKYQTTGQLTVQIFGTLNDGNEYVDAVAQALAGTFRSQFGSPDGVWFFDVEPIEVGQTKNHFQTNLNASIRFQEKVS